VRYKTVIEVVTDGDDANDAMDRAGEYLRGSYHSDVPLRVRTQPMGTRNVRVLGYTVAMCFLALSISFGWFAAGRTYQKIVSTKDETVEMYAVHPPLSTDITNEAGRAFKEKWDKAYKDRVLYGPDASVDSE